MDKIAISDILKLAFKAIVLNFICIYVAYAQVVPPKPAACTTPPAGFLLGGDFTVPQSPCSSPANPNLPITAKYSQNGNFSFPNAVQYIFGYNDNIDITASDFNADYAGFNGTTFSTKKELTPGVHWVLQIAESEGKKYLKCRTTEIIRTDPPEANIYTCDGTTVFLKIDKSEKNNHNKYSISWGDGTNEDIEVDANTLPLEKAHTYTGKLSQISLTGFYVRGGTSVCSTNPVLKDPQNAQNPVLTGLISLEGGAKVDFKNIISDQKYDLQVTVDNGSSYTWESKGQSNDGTFSISGLDKSKKYCYRIATKDKCDKPVYSNVVCDINISSTSASSSQASVVWSLPTIPTGNPSQMELLRDVEGCDNCLKQLSLFSNLDRKFSDESLECSKIYTYQIVTQYAVLQNGVTEIITIESEKIVVNPMDASVELIPNGLIQAGFPNNDDSMIRLILLDNSDAKEFTFFHKGADDEGFIEIGKTKTNSFNDISIQANSGEYCYKYQVEDACGITSEISPEFCTVFLSYQGTTLNWTDFTFPNTIITSTPAEYTVESFDENIGAFLPQFKISDLSKGVGLLIQDSDNPTIKFRILAQQFVDIPGFTDFSIPSYSNTVEMPIPADIFIPSAFSPNGDGQNETFQIKSKFVEDGTINIYDRWGSILFNGSLDGVGWDGNSPNSMVPVPGGNYTYKIKGRSIAGEEFSRNGILTLLK